MTTAIAGRRQEAGGPQVQSLSRGLTLLEQLALAPDGISLSELASRVGLAASTAHRMLRTLRGHGFAELSDATGLWRVGVRAMEVGAAFLHGRDLVALARPALARLAELTGETSNLAVPSEHDAIYLSQVESTHPVRALARVGARVPLNCSGVGLALLAAMPETERRLRTRREFLRRCTEFSLDRPERLDDALAETLRRGFALDDQGQALGMRCVAAAVTVGGRPVAALSVSGPAERLPPLRIAETGALVARTAVELGRQLVGATPDYRAVD
jgi:IclR family acetate operon transcriptional repressor